MGDDTPLPLGFLLLIGYAPNRPKPLPFPPQRSLAEILLAERPTGGRPGRPRKTAWR